MVMLLAVFTTAGAQEKVLKVWPGGLLTTTG